MLILVVRHISFESFLTWVFVYFLYFTDIFSCKCDKLYTDSHLHLLWWSGLSFYLISLACLTVARHFRGKCTSAVQGATYWVQLSLMWFKMLFSLSSLQTDFMLHVWIIIIDLWSLSSNISPFTSCHGYYVLICCLVFNVYKF